MLKLIINVSLIAATRQCSIHGNRSVLAFRYPSLSTITASTTISRHGQPPVHKTPGSTPTTRPFMSRSSRYGCNGTRQNPTSTFPLKLLHLQIQTQQQQRPHRRTSSLAMPMSTYDTSVEAFPSIVIGPDRSIEPQGSFAEAQAQVGLVVQSIIRSLSYCIVWCPHPHSPLSRTTTVHSKVFGS